MFMLMLLQLWGQIQRLPYKPPATLAIMAANLGIHMYRPQLPFSDQAVCLQPASIVAGDYKRLVMSAFFHGSNSHVYYNMVSLLWKGVQLEQRMGSEAFVGMTAVLLLLSHGLYVLSSWLMVVSGFDPGAMATCAVGYSAVLFAYKVVLNYDSPRMTSVWGIPVPLKYAAWLELVVISLITPNASFLGHLCGIFAGLCFVMKDKLIPYRLLPSFARRAVRNGVLEPEPRPVDRRPAAALNQRDDADAKFQRDMDEALRRSSQAAPDVLRRRRLDRFSGLM